MKKKHTRQPSPTTSTTSIYPARDKANRREHQFVSGQEREARLQLGPFSERRDQFSIRFLVAKQELGSISTRKPLRRNGAAN